MRGKVGDKMACRIEKKKIEKVDKLKRNRESKGWIVERTM